jgi:translocation and assembly module TamB
LSQADDTEEAAPKPARQRPARRGGRLHLSLLAELLIALALLAAVAAGVRFGPLTAPGRAAVMAYLDGVSLGPWGRLHATGLHGDLWSDFTIDRLSVSDSQGIWLDLGRLQVKWRPVDLLIRRFYAQSISASEVRVFRRPVLGPSPPPKPGAEAPLSVKIDRLALRLETRPAFSVREGLFDIAANLDLDHKGGIGGAIKLKSLLRPSDGLDARFDVGLSKHLFLDAAAREGDGGAISGALGLPANQTFAFIAKADGTDAQGQFHLQAISGARTPASADGTWNQAGGQGKAMLSLTASTFTAPYAAALGPQLNIDLSARTVDQHDLNVTGSLHTDNLTGSASGLVRDHAGAPKGLKLTAVIRDLTRIVATPVMGAGAFNGTLSGGVADWRLTGALAVNKIAAQGYALARAEGPLSLAVVKGELRLQASLAGQGGAGQGMVAALAGARPRLSLQASRFPDGRILLRSLSADGAGLSLTATGDRNLLGGLNLKGALRLSNLAAAGKGAAGLLDAHWSAAQARATAPWSLTLDAQGQGLATGYAELDRLLGSKPALHVQTDLSQGVISVTDARLTGAAAALGAKGQIGKAGELKLALNWNAQGPFDAGPLEVSGKANGSGALTGTFAAPRADLLADFEQIELPYLVLKPAHLVLSFVHNGTDTDGLIAINAGGAYGPAHAKAGFRFVNNGVELKDVDAAAGGMVVKGSLALLDAAPSLVDLTLSLASGAFASEGSANARIKIADAGSGPAASVRLSADDLVLRGSGVAIQTARLSADGPLSRLPFKVTAEAAANGAPIRFSGLGTVARSGQTTAISFDGGGRVRKADFHTLSPAQFTLGPETTSQLSLSLGGGRADISTRQDAQGVAAKGTLSGVDLTALGEDLAGKFDADFSLAGKGASLDGTLNARLTDARSRDATSSLALEGTVKAMLSGQHLTVNASGGAKNGGRASVDVTLPADASAAPFRVAVNPARPMQGRFDADGELQPIWDLFFGGDRSLGGKLVAQGTLGGSLNNPVLVGHAAMSDGKLEDAATGLKLRNLAANVDLTNNLVTVQTFSASDAKAGTVTGDGRLSLVKGGESTLTLNVKGFQLLDTDTAKATATGAVTVTRAGDGHAKLSGQLDIDHAEISALNRSPPGVVSLDVIERNRPGAQDQTPAAVASRAPAVGLNIKLRAARGIYLKGLGLNAEMSLSADVTGDTAAPQLSGTAHVLRGAYDFAGKRFDIDDTSVVYLDAALDRIHLDLSATRDDPTLTAVIRIKGTAAKPVITLTSTPALPSDEVLSQVLFGKSAAQLSGGEAAQLAAAVTTLATGGGFDLIGGLRSFVKLDRLALGADTLGAPTVSGGKYINEHVYLELTGGGKDGPSAQVEVTAGRGLSFLSQVGGLEGAKLAVRWRLNYGKAKTPRPK